MSRAVRRLVGTSAGDGGGGSTPSYEDKLIAALTHPVATHQMAAIMTLGLLRSRRAVRPLRDLLGSEPDLYVALEVLKTLARIGGPQATNVLREATHDRARLVREAAMRHLQQRGGEAEPGRSCR